MTQRNLPTRVVAAGLENLISARGTPGTASFVFIGNVSDKVSWAFQIVKAVEAVASGGTGGNHGIGEHRILRKRDSRDRKPLQLKTLRA